MKFTKFIFSVSLFSCFLSCGIKNIKQAEAKLSRSSFNVNSYDLKGAL